MRPTASSSTCSPSRPGLQGALVDAGVSRYDWYPMIRGRLVAINGQPVTPTVHRRPRAAPGRARVQPQPRARLPAHNQLVGGRWVPDEADGLSVEEGLAQTLGLKLGDTLRFDIAGQTKEGRITSVRKVDWGSMRVNFFVMFPRAPCPSCRRPHQRLPRARAAGLRQCAEPLSQHHQRRRVGQHRAGAARARPGHPRGGVPVRLHAGGRPGGAVRRHQRHARGARARIRHHARDGRRQPAAGAGAAGRTAGRGRAGGPAGVGGGGGMGWLLARYAFEFSWNPSPWVPLAGAAGRRAAGAGAGWWGLREVLRRPVLETLRRAGAM
jgi:putative ABC transport system permease protein